MRTGTKIVLSFVTVMLFGVILTGINKETGSHTGAGFGIILAFAMAAAVRAIWKYNPDPIDESSSDKHHLNKR